jgi:hypothetical protein
MAHTEANTNEAAIWKAINQILSEMETVTADSPEFAKMVDQLVTLYKALPPTKEKESIVKWDTLATVAGNLLGIGMILGFERAGVITSKALGFVMKAKA